MKIFVNDKVYVQKNDLAYLMRGAGDISIPISIINKVFGDIFIVTDENRYEFIEFSSSFFATKYLLYCFLVHLISY